MLNNHSPIFKAIYTGVRPARIVTLINENDKEWMDTCFRVIEWYSQMWGGRYNLIVPTNGESISEEFWFLMEAFDPDYIYAYQKTMLDLKLSSPDEYSNWLEQQVEKFIRENPDSERECTRESMDGQIRQIAIDGFPISDTLKHEILSRLNPFHSAVRPIEHWVYALDGVHYPLTSLTKILPNSDLSTIFDLEVDSNKIIQLIIYSVSGLLNSFKINLSKQIEENSRQSGGLRIVTPGANELDAIKENIQQAKYGGDSVRNLLRFVWSAGRETTGVGDLFQYTPFSTAMVGLELYHRGYPELWRVPIILVIGDTVNDFCLYYTLYRLRGQVYWVPSEIFESHRKVVDGREPTAGSAELGGNLLFSLLSEIVSQIDYGHSEKKIVVTSLSKSKEDLDVIVDDFDKAYPIHLGMDTDEEKTKTIRDFIRVSAEMPQLLPYVAQVFEQNNYPTYYGTEQFINGESVNYVNTPRPKNFRRIDPNGHYWIAELNVEGYKLPTKAVLSTMVIKHKTYSTREIRISKYGIDYHCPNIAYFGGDIDTTLVRPKLRLPDIFDVFKAIFEEAGYDIALSDKGNFQRISTSKFGALEDIAETLLNQKYRQLFDKVIDETPSIQEVYDKGVFLCKGEPRYLDLASIEKIVGNEHEVRELLDNLVGKGVLHRGFILKCSRCRNADWYSINEVRDIFVCRRCGFGQPCGSDNLRIQQGEERLEPKWYYRLDEVVYQGYRHDMIVPVLALYKLQRSAQESFLFIPEINIWVKNGSSSRPYLEIDICCVIDGEIVIGECKKGYKLEDTASKEKRKVKTYKYLGEKIGAGKVVFATLSDSWRPATANLIAEIFGSSRTRIELLSTDNLLD